MTERGEEAGRGTEGEDHRTHRTGAEWTMFAVSAAFIAALVGALAVDWAAGPARPAAFRTRVEAVRPVDAKFQVPVRVENIGSQTAAGVRVGAELELGGEVVDIDEMLDFVAPGESTTLTFVFDRDPRRGRLSVSVRAFKEP